MNRIYHLKSKAKGISLYSGRRIGFYFYEVFFAFLTGLAAGGAGIAFYHCMSFVTKQRMTHPMFLFLLPVGGILIVFLYQFTGQQDNKGTNLVLLAIHEDTDIPPVIAPLMFISTLLTHLCGGSAGREGAALQIGGSIGGFIGNLFHFKRDSVHIFVMCGMSACFSAVFGTPLAAAIFSMEVFHVGVLVSSALVPCVVASFTACILAGYFHAPAEHYLIREIPAFNFISAGKILLFALLIAAASMLFCLSLHTAEHLYKKHLENPYLRAAAGGAMIIALTFLIRSRDYTGAGTAMIAQCFEGTVPWYAFALKILFTALTLGAGYKGGEIVPSFFTGATLGCVLGPLFGLPSGLTAACGMTGLFCGATNCPLTSIFIAIELFGLQAMPFYVITIAACYMMSGYYSLYSTQIIYLSKFRMKVLDRKTH